MVMPQPIDRRAEQIASFETEKIKVEMTLLGNNEDNCVIVSILRKGIDDEYESTPTCKGDGLHISI